MAGKVFLIHGWSVTQTSTYQALHVKLAQHGFTLSEIFLGRYVSLDNQVTIEDLSLALHRALGEHLGKPPWKGPIHMLTHSTGALVVKDWIARSYAGAFADKKPLKNVVFLAGPHFGSRLAHHGRSVFSYLRHAGRPGRRILEALELGSSLSWSLHDRWLQPQHWRQKGVRPFCLTGDRIDRSTLTRLFPPAMEAGSDMVVRVPAANLNFRRLRFHHKRKRVAAVGKLEGIPFGALGDFTHSGDRFGIMNSVTTTTDPKTPRGLSLKLILQCLKVAGKADYEKAGRDLAAITRATQRRKKKGPFAQIDFRFLDETGAPVDDYRFNLGVIRGDKIKQSDAITHVHTNRANGSHRTFFVDLGRLDYRSTYHLEFDSDSGSDAFEYEPDPLEREIPGSRLREILVPHQTTQVEIVVGRKPREGLFVFHPGDDPDLHVKWNRRGQIKKTKISWK